MSNPTLATGLSTTGRTRSHAPRTSARLPDDSGAQSSPDGRSAGGLVYSVAGSGGDPRAGTSAALGSETPTWTRSFWLLLAAMFLAYFALYQSSHLSGVQSVDFNDYPFGSDTPRYLTSSGNRDFHLLTAGILKAWRIVLGILSVEETPALTKIPFALVGALNVCIAGMVLRFFAPPVRSLLYACAYGCLLTVWYFAATPESYTVSTLLYSLYLLAFVAAARRGMTLGLAIGMAAMLFLALLNDVSALFLTMIPLLLYGVRSFQDKAVRQAAILQLGAGLLALVILVAKTDLFALYLDAIDFYSPLAHQAAESSESVSLAEGAPQAVLNFLFFGAIAPSAEVTYATARFPEYHGYFKPSLVSYFGSLLSIIGLLAYASLYAFIRISRVSRLVVALSSLIGLRFIAVVLFNPGESILYTCVSMLAMMATLVHFVEASELPRKTLYASLLAPAFILANARFLFA